MLVTGGVIWVREGDSGDVGGPVFVDTEEFCRPVLYASWSLFWYWGRQAWQYVEWTCIFSVD